MMLPLKTNKKKTLAILLVRHTELLQVDFFAPVVSKLFSFFFSVVLVSQT